MTNRKLLEAVLHLTLQHQISWEHIMCISDFDLQHAKDKQNHSGQEALFWKHYVRMQNAIIYAFKEPCAGNRSILHAAHCKILITMRACLTPKIILPPPCILYLQSRKPTQQTQKLQLNPILSTVA